MKIIGQKLYQLMSKDLIKGFLTAIFTVLVTYAGQCLERQEFPMDAVTWILELKIAIGAGVAYLMKNFLSNSNGQFLKAEPKQEDAK